MATDRPRVGVPEERIRALRAVELFDGLGLDALSELGGVVSDDSHGPGAVLSSEDTPNWGLWMVMSGGISVSETRSEEVHSYTLREGGAVGEWALLAERRTPLVIGCMQDARVLHLSASAWEDLAFRRPDIHLEVLQNFVRTVAGWGSWSADVRAARGPLFPGKAPPLQP